MSKDQANADVLTSLQRSGGRALIAKAVYKLNGQGFFPGIRTLQVLKEDRW